jgi:hypothetical protein
MKNLLFIVLALIIAFSFTKGIVFAFDVVIAASAENWYIQRNPKFSGWEDESRKIWRNENCRQTGKNYVLAVPITGAKINQDFYLFEPQNKVMVWITCDR